jgi:tetratricopeptide (TPR) repeat protein
VPAMPVTSDARFMPNSNLHEPFLRRAADSEDGVISGVALGGFLTLRLADVFDGRFERLSADALVYQVQATRDYLGDLYPATAEVKHLQEIVRASQKGFEQRNRRVLWPTLLAFAFWLEQELRLEEALDVLDTAMGLSDGKDGEEEVATLLQKARVLRLTGSFEDAESYYTSAGERAHRRGDKHSELLGRIGLGIILEQRGNLPQSESVLRAVLKEAESTGDRDAMARACHDLSGTLAHMKRHGEAAAFAFRAFQLYDQHVPQLRALVDVGILLKNTAMFDAAEDAFHLVLGQGPPPEVHHNTIIELLDVAGSKRDRVGFERWRKACGDIEPQLPGRMVVDLRFKLGLCWARFGEQERARAALQETVQLANQYRMFKYAIEAETALSNIEKLNTQVRQKPEAIPEDAAVAGIANRLHALRVEGVPA